MMHLLACHYCGIEFVHARARIRFCSKACVHSHLRDIRRSTFWERTREDPSGCLIWTGERTRNGYGRTSYGLAHRSAYELAVGPIPDGLLVLHSCDVKLCVLPAHLRVGTQKDNMADMRSRGRARDRYGVMHPRAKLTPELVAAVRRRNAEGESFAKLARHYGVGITTIQAAVSRRTWRAVA